MLFDAGSDPRGGFGVVGEVFGTLSSTACSATSSQFVSNRGRLRHHWSLRHPRTALFDWSPCKLCKQVCSSRHLVVQSGIGVDFVFAISSPHLRCPPVLYEGSSKASSRLGMFALSLEGQDYLGFGFSGCRRRLLPFPYHYTSAFTGDPYLHVLPLTTYGHRLCRSYSFLCQWTCFQSNIF